MKAEPPRIGHHREYPTEGNLDMLTCMFFDIISPQCLGEPQVNNIRVLTEAFHVSVNPWTYKKVKSVSRRK